MNADALRRALGLQPHPEGGAFAETYRSAQAVGERRLATAIAFLLRAGEVSRWHRVASDELWIHQGGDPLRLRQLDAAGTLQDHWLGLDVDAGQRPQLLIPGGDWQAAIASTPGHHGWTLACCVVAPGFEFADFTLASDAEMAQAFPALAEALRLSV